MAEALELTAAIVKALDAKRAMGIEVLHTTDVTTLADYFIMCSAASTTQLRTLSDACEEAAEKLGEVPHHIEGGTHQRLGAAGLQRGHHPPVPAGAAGIL